MYPVAATELYLPPNAIQISKADPKGPAKYCRSLIKGLRSIENLTPAGSGGSKDVCCGRDMDAGDEEFEE